MVFGQMNETSGVKGCAQLNRFVMAEYFRDQGMDVLLFIDNIFRFTMSGSEVSALLGRMPSAVGYQPTLYGNGGIARKDHEYPPRVDHFNAGGICAQQMITPSCACGHFSHLDATIALERSHLRERYLSSSRSISLHLTHIGFENCWWKSIIKLREKYSAYCSVTKIYKISSRF